MKDMKKKIIPIAGIAVFCLLIYFLITFEYNYLTFNVGSIYNFIDLPSALVVIGGGGALAFAKMPKNINDFLKYFSKTSILSGGAASIIGLVNMLGAMDTGAGDLMSNVAVALLTIFYGLIFSGISYALSRDTTE